MPATLRDDVDRELVELLTGDTAWVRRQFDALVAAEFPTDPPEPAPPILTGAAGPVPPAPPARPGRPAARRGRRPSGSHRCRQRSPPGRHPVATRRATARRVASLR